MTKRPSIAPIREAHFRGLDVANKKGRNPELSPPACSFDHRDRRGISISPNLANISTDGISPLPRRHPSKPLPPARRPGRAWRAAAPPLAWPARVRGAQ